MQTAALSPFNYSASSAISPIEEASFLGKTWKIIKNLWLEAPGDLLIGCSWFICAASSISTFAREFFSSTASEKDPEKKQLCPCWEKGLNCFVYSSYFFDWCLEKKIFEILFLGNGSFKTVISGGSLLREGTRCLENINEIQRASATTQLEENFSLPAKKTGHTRLIQGLMDFMTNFTFLGYSSFRLVGIILGAGVVSPFILDGFAFLSFVFMGLGLCHQFIFFETLENPSLESFAR